MSGSSSTDNVKAQYEALLSEERIRNQKLQEDIQKMADEKTKDMSNKQEQDKVMEELETEYERLLGEERKRS